MLFIIIASLILPTLSAANPVSAQVQHKALILSSLERFAPMRGEDLMNIKSSLAQAGYTVTYLKDNAVTLNLLTTQLNNYEIIIWRTNVYEQAHNIYWYIGPVNDIATQQAYAPDFNSGWLDSSHGILGASADFFSNHFNQTAFSNVKLLIIISSMSSVIADSFVAAGARSVIDFAGIISLQFNWIDYLTSVIVMYLAQGYDVADAVSATIVPLLTMRLEDSLDSMLVPSVSYLGDYTVTIV